MISITRHEVKDKTLASYIKFFWQFEEKCGDIHYKLLPTDAIDVILNLGDDMIYEENGRRLIAPTLHINGRRQTPSYIHQKGKIQVFGISFHAFGLYPFINNSLAPLQNRIAELSDFSRPLANGLKSAVTIPSLDSPIINMERVLLSFLRSNKEDLRPIRLIHNFLESAGQTTIHTFCAEAGVNLKTFERMTLRCTGFTPKVLHRVSRFQKSANQLVHQKSLPLVDIIYGNLYADQSHFIKEFRSFTGAAPKAFQEEKQTVKENVKYTYR